MDHEPTAEPTSGPDTYALDADACLERVASWLEAFDPDEMDYTSADGVLKIEFPDGMTFVLNRQAAARQMWFAANASAWHYSPREDGAWICEKDGRDLYESIATAISEKLNRTVTF